MSDIEFQYHAGGFLKHHRSKIVYCLRSFYAFSAGKYMELDVDDLKARVIRYFHNQTDRGNNVHTGVTNAIVEHLKGLCHIESKGPPCWISNQTRGLDYFPMENGLLDLTAHGHGGLATLWPHNEDFFSFTKLPYSFDPAKSCPRWLCFLAEVLPSQGLIDLLQEWFGYHLLPDIQHEKMMIFFGEGSNGKSVICAVMQLFLGKENVSAVSLDQFDPSRTFPLVPMIGKLANICEELPTVGRADEALLKQFVSRSPVTLEKKYEHPFTVTPTPLLTFATNALPQYQDKSDGIWRRQLIVPFTTKIEDAKQDKRLKSPAFWINSGELPGIFNWALEGRQRLIDRGRFAEPPESAAAKETFRQEMNSAMAFLKGHYCASPTARISSNDLYSQYKEHVLDLGEVPIPANQFPREVKRVFPGAELLPNPIRLNDKGKKGRAWQGIEMVDDS